MKTVKYKLGEKYPERGCALALGFFDGVHLGHRELLCRAVCAAKEKGTSSAVFTFSYGGGIKSGQAMIYSDKEREELFTSIGIDVCFVADFADLKDLSPERFVFETIVGDIGASTVFAGYNYRFGKNGAADATELSRLMTACGGEAVIFEPFTCEGRPVSSTRVRALLEGGEIEDANAMLGLPYFVRGAVEHGRGDGRGFGYPTVNISVGKERVRLKRGVYLTAVKIGDEVEIFYVSGSLKFKVLNIKETVKKDEAASLYEVIL